MQAIDHFKQFLIGSDARNISALWQQMYELQYKCQLVLEFSVENAEVMENYP